MNNLTDLVTDRLKKIKETQNKKIRVNLKWEQAKDFCTYCGFNVDNKIIIFTLKLCKIYGDQRVFGLKSWLKDANYDSSRLQGLLVWKLKNDTQNKYRQSAV